MASIQPELWADDPRAALEFYRTAFGARVLLRLGDGVDTLAQVTVDGAVFWIGGADRTLNRLDPRRSGGTTSRTLLVVDDPDAVVAAAVRAGAELTTPVADEHGWRLGRLVDPAGHEWEIGRPHPADPAR